MQAAAVDHPHATTKTICASTATSRTAATAQMRPQLCDDVSTSTCAHPPRTAAVDAANTADMATATAAANSANSLAAAPDMVHLSALSTPRALITAQAPDASGYGHAGPVPATTSSSRVSDGCPSSDVHVGQGQMSCLSFSPQYN